MPRLFIGITPQVGSLMIDYPVLAFDPPGSATT